MIENSTRISESEGLEQEFLELWLPDPADEEYPTTPKSFYGYEKDMAVYMDSVNKGMWSNLHKKRLSAYQKYCDGDIAAKVRWMNKSMPLFIKRKVEYQQESLLEDIHWLHVDRNNRLVPLRAKKILLDQVILEVEGEYVLCVRPTFDGLEQADYQQGRWMPVYKNLFPTNAIESQDERFVSLLYIEAGRYRTLCLALTATEHPAQLDFRAVMDEFFGEFTF